MVDFSFQNPQGGRGIYIRTLTFAAKFQTAATSQTLCFEGGAKPARQGFDKLSFSWALVLISPTQ